MKKYAHCKEFLMHDAARYEHNTFYADDIRSFCQNCLAFYSKKIKKINLFIIFMYTCKM